VLGILPIFDKSDSVESEGKCGETSAKESSTRSGRKATSPPTPQALNMGHTLAPSGGVIHAVEVVEASFNLQCKERTGKANTQTGLQRKEN
jgi:hypothetical protein